MQKTLQIPTSVFEILKGQKSIWIRGLQSLAAASRKQSEWAYNILSQLRCSAYRLFSTNPIQLKDSRVGQPLSHLRSGGAKKVKGVAGLGAGGLRLGAEPYQMIMIGRGTKLVHPLWSSKFIHSSSSLLQKRLTNLERSKFILAPRRSFKTNFSREYTWRCLYEKVFNQI